MLKCRFGDFCLFLSLIWLKDVGSVSVKHIELSRLISASWVLIMMLSMLRSLKYWFDEIIGEKLFEHLSYSFIGGVVSLYI